jgi:hypothetical protein
MVLTAGMEHTRVVPRPALICARRGRPQPHYRPGQAKSAYVRLGQVKKIIFLPSFPASHLAGLVVLGLSRDCGDGYNSGSAPKNPQAVTRLVKPAQAPPPREGEGVRSSGFRNRLRGFKTF